MEALTLLLLLLQTILIFYLCHEFLGKIETTAFLYYLIEMRIIVRRCH